MRSILKSGEKTIRIGIDGGDFQPFGKVNSGIKRIVDAFLKEIYKLKKNNFVFNYYYFGKEKIMSKVKHINFIKLPNKLFASFFLPIHFKKEKNNIFLGFSGYLPSLIDLTNVKKVLFLYDLGFLKFPQLYVCSKELLSNTLNVVQRADKIIVLTDYAKKELEERINNINEKQLIRIYPGMNHLQDCLENASINPPSPRLRRAGRLIDTKFTKYFLYIGVIKPVKNIHALLRYFLNFLEQSADKNYQLMIIGQREEKYFNQLLKEHYYIKLKDKIIFKENISDKKLIKYYLQSTALLNFSYEEGLCFPVLEALSLGKKAIVNNLPIYQEFTDKFDNLLIGKNEKEIIRLMIKTAKSYDQDLLNKKLQSQSVFTWKNFTENLLEIIKEG